jgi:hypothetical protein
MPVSGTAVLALCLATSAGGSSLSDLEQSYLSTRDEQIRRFDAIAAGSTPDEKSRGLAPDKLDKLYEDDKDALRHLEKMLHSIIGPVNVPGVSGPGRINLQTLTKDLGFGDLDGLSFDWGRDTLLVTTPGLFDRWVAGRSWRQKPSDHLAVARTDEVYTFASFGDIACFLLGEIPVERPQGVSVVQAFLAGYSQDQGPTTPTDLLVFVDRGDRIFIVRSRIDPPLKPIAACEAERKVYEGNRRYLDSDFEVYRRCYGRATRDRVIFAPLHRKAQLIVGRLEGGSTAP